MVKLVKGYAGSGKTEALVNDVNELLQNSCECSPLILASTLEDKQNLLERLNTSDNITIFSLDEFCRYILKNSDNSNKEILSDFFAINIIKIICKREFLDDKAMFSLTKSNSFFREFYNILFSLKNNEISSDKFLKALNEADISVVEKNRLELLLKVFDEYNDMLKEFDYLDYSDMVSIAVASLADNSNLLRSLKTKFSHFFVDNFENITYLQFKLIKYVADSENLYFYGDKCQGSQGFKGVWDYDLGVESLNECFESVETVELMSSERNQDILQRAVFILEKFNSKQFDCGLLPANSIEYRCFEDVESEISFIAKQIKEVIANQNCKFSDFAILIRNFESKEKLSDLLKVHGIPVGECDFNESLKNLKFEILKYLNICNICENLAIEKFAAKDFASLSPSLKVESEIYFEELNLYIQNILTDILGKNYCVDKFLMIQEEKAKLSFIDVVYENIDILEAEDKEKVLVEFEMLSAIYKSYKENNFDKWTRLIANKNNIVEDEKSRNIFEAFLSKIIATCEFYLKVLKVRPDLSVFTEVLSTFSPKNSSENAVNILTFFSVGSKKFKYVYIPSMIEGDFPKAAQSVYFISPDSNEKISCSLKKINPHFKKLIESGDESLKDEIRLFYRGITRAKNKLYISTYEYKDKKKVLPSSFFNALVSADKLNFRERDENLQTASYSVADSEIKPKVSVGQKVCAENILRLSYSSINTFLYCPRKFYYTNLLNLSEKSTFWANYGSVLHAVFEVFNNTCLGKYTKEYLLTLANILFNSVKEPEKAYEAGFANVHIEAVKASDDLRLAEMKESFEDAASGLEQSGFFENVPDKIYTEKSFKFELKELPNIVFTGKIDAIYKYGENYKIVDYKSGENKKKPLSYYLSDYGVNFQGDYARYAGVFNQNLVSEYEYQIPVYYLASQFSEELKDFKDNISEFGFMYIRPVSKDGYNDDFISAEAINMQKDKILQNIKETVIDKIRNESEFAKTDSDRKCLNCSFCFLCDKDFGKEFDENDG